MVDLQVWQGRIERAEGLQSKQHKDWKDAIDLYNCDYFNKIYGGIDPERVDVNFAKWYVDKVIPLVYFRDPFIFIKSRGDKYSAFADTMETVINTEWRRLKLKKQFKRVILSSCLTTPGWLKLGYTAKIGQDVAKIEEFKQKSIIDSIKDTITGVFEKKAEDYSPEELGILNAYIKEESVFATWIPSWNILMPEGYQIIEQMPYLIEIEEVPKIDFLANPLYKNKSNLPQRRTVRKDTPKRETINTGSYNQDGYTYEEDTIRLYHIWDRREQQRFTMSLEATDVHFQGDWCYDMEGFPYKPLMFEDNLPQKDKSNPYPTNILKPVMSQIIEKSSSRTQMSKWRKRASAIILAQSGAATDEDLHQLQETEAIQLVKVSNIGAFQMTQSPALPNQVFEIDEIIDKDLQMGTSMGQLMFQAQSGQRTATQAQIGQGGLQAKMSANVDCIEDYTVEVAMDMAQLAWQFYDKDKVEEIIGEKVTDDMWIELPEDPKERRRIIRSEIQFKIDAGSTAPPKDETVDRKQLLDYASIVMSIAPERIKKDEFIKQLTKKFKFVKDVDKIIIGFEEEETQKAQGENQLMLQGAPQLVGPNEPHDIHIQQHQQAAGHPLVDKHMVEHGQRMGINPQSKGGGGGQQGGGPQEGDKRPPKQSTNPEIARQGIPKSGDIMQSAQNIGPGSKNRGAV